MIESRPSAKGAEADDAEPTPRLADSFLFGLDMMTVSVSQLVQIKLLMCVMI